ncbi:MAG: 3-hydroxyacyl-CoA dehydrogenase [Candidatus Binatia bacterium]|nr:MAG: 3-hydroxyacyl-CoA dehydrogenase [Candidatus Binatia bacterium]
MELRKVAILGANGTMGAGSAEVFAAGGCEVFLLARSRDRALEGVRVAQNLAKSERIADRMQVGSYDEDFEKAVGSADLVFEALAEDLQLKSLFFERVDACRRPDSVVATVSSGLSIARMASGRSESFQRHFLGIHLFNPPNVIVGTEVIPHGGTDPELVRELVPLLERRFGRKVVVCRDKPAFCGNRVGFKVLNEVAQLAGRHGVAFLDYLIGPHTGRAMPPLATVDLVGWDVHKAIVDNVYELVRDEAHEAFRLPDYMARLVDEGRLGNKTPDRGGFYKRVQKDGRRVELCLDPSTGEYHEPRVEKIPFVERMKELHHVGKYRDAWREFASATGPEAELAHRVVLGYVSYALHRVGPDEVVDHARDVDRIMAFGFNWAPPTVLVDLLGLRETWNLLDRYGLPVPPLLREARPGERLYQERSGNIGRFFAG